MSEFYIIEIMFFTALAFIFTIAWTPLWTNILYRYKLGKQIRGDGTTPIFTALHLQKSGTPTMGGVLVWVTTLFFAVASYYIAQLFPDGFLGKINFLTRKETLLPLGCLVASALVGLVDDYMDVRHLGPKGRGIQFRHKLLIFAAIALVGAWWFFGKLDWHIVHLPFLGYFSIGWWYVPFFIATVVTTAFAVNQTDGLDGLAGGTLIIAFASYSVIAFAQGRFDLSVFCAVIVGALLAFLWFNINPARFFMGDTGSMSLGVTLALVALYTNTVMYLPLIGFIFLVEAASTVIQILSKKLRAGKKVFRSAPIHHHYQARGWSEPKVVMRFWVMAGVWAVIGLLLFLLDRTI